MKKICKLLWFQLFVVIIVAETIPTTLDGPFKPLTRRFDLFLVKGSDDLPMDHPRLKRNVTSFFPEQIALALSSSSTSMWISWITGEAQIGLNVTPHDPKTVASEVWYGKESGKYTMKQNGVSVVYSQLYPFEGLWNYTYGIIHHVKIDGKDSRLSPSIPPALDIAAAQVSSLLCYIILPVVILIGLLRNH